MITISTSQFNYKKRNKKIKFSKFLFLIMLMPIFLLYFELVLRAGTSKDFFGIGLLFLLFFSLATGLVISFVTCLFKKIPRYAITMVITVIFTIYYAVQLVYYKVFSNFMIWFSLINGTAAIGENTGTIMNTITKNIFFLILMFVPLILLICIRKKHLSIFKVTPTLKILVITFAIVLQIIALLVINLDNEGGASSKFLYYESSQVNTNVERFGMFTASRLDFIKLFAGNSKKSDVPVDVETPSSSSNLTSGQNSEQIGKPQTLDLDFDKLISNGTNNEVKKLHEYFNTVTPTTKNDKTGKFSDYNLIYITAESFSDYVVDKDLTPTLYKMANEGYNFTNFYNPEWGVSTSDGEYQNSIGLVPKAGVWSFFKQGYLKNALPFTLGNQFRFKGITPRAYHNNTFDYYDRDISHPNAGYLYKGIGNGLQIKKTWPESDLEMVEKSIDDYINEPQFHTYYMSVSGHMDYTWVDNYFSNKYKNKVSNLNLSEQAKAYIACNIDFDLAMEFLIRRLHEKGIANKTLIVIGSDHYPYGLEDTTLLELAGKSSFSPDFEKYKSRLIIWSEDLKGDNGKKIDKLCGSMDMLPTTLNLMGLPFDSRMLAGHDIFSDAPGLVMFQDYSWKSEDGYYIPKGNVFTNTSNKTLPQTYSKDINNYVLKSFWSGTKMLENDYFRYILTKSQMDIINNPIPCPAKIK